MNGFDRTGNNRPRYSHPFSRLPICRPSKFGNRWAVNIVRSHKHPLWPRDKRTMKAASRCLLLSARSHSKSHRLQQGHRMEALIRLTNIFGTLREATFSKI